MTPALTWLPSVSIFQKMPATTQSVTKSSHYVSVQQSSSAGGGTTSRYLAWSVRGRQHYFCSLQGILRIIEIILILIVLIMARVGAKVGISAL